MRVAAELRPGAPPDREALERMGETLARRGPDGHGTWLNGGAGARGRVQRLHLQPPRAARGVLSDSVRIDESALHDATARLRIALGDLTGPIADAVAALGQLETLAASARRVPLTSVRRVPREPVLDLLDRLHVVVPQAVSNP